MIWLPDDLVLRLGQSFAGTILRHEHPRKCQESVNKSLSERGRILAFVHG